MAINISNHSFVKCDYCEAIIAYEDKEAWVETEYMYGLFEKKTIKHTNRLIWCPNCHKKILVSEIKNDIVE